MFLRHSETTGWLTSGV